MKTRVTFFFAALIACCLLLAGCESVAPEKVQPNLGLTGTSSAKVNRPPITSPIHQVALLLPIGGGEFASTSKAINNGFLAAYYEADQQKSGISIKVVDTYNQDIVSVYNQTVAKGVDLVIGPLTKQEVTALAKINPLPVPTLALNTIDNYYASPIVNLYQFGLSPQDETIQVAIKIVKDGHHNAAVIVPSNPWGQGLYQAFQKQLQLQGGQITAKVDYESGDDFDLKIRELLKVDSAQLREKNRKSILHRQDIDAIFLIANPAAARQIAPLLKYYYEGSIALYGSSSIYQGDPNPDMDRDLDDVIFCDMPWTINTNTLPLQLQEIRNKITTLWPDSLTGGNSRLYALGIDAFNLASAFDQVLLNPKAGFKGTTGLLFLDDYNHIYRKLDFATMKEGAVVN